MNNIGPEDFVMIKFPRDARPFIVMLGVWKAGAAFTVVEDSYAPERIEAIKKDCGCRLVIDEDIVPRFAVSPLLCTAPGGHGPGHEQCHEEYRQNTQRYILTDSHLHLPLS